MRATNIGKDNATVTVSANELAFLCNVINEALGIAAASEFQALIGETRERAIEMHLQLREILTRASGP